VPAAGWAPPRCCPLSATNVLIETCTERLLELGRVFVAMEDRDEAVAAFEAALALDPSDWADRREMETYLEEGR